MGDATAKFLVFSLFGLVSLTLGYAARRRGWVREDVSRPVHYVTVVFVWPAAMLLSIWHLPPDTKNLWFLLVEPVLVAAGAYLAIPLARLVGCRGGKVGVVALAAGLSNTGFTLGAYLCYSILTPAEEALAYGVVVVTVMSAVTPVFLYPIAMHYGEQSGAKRSALKLVVGSYLDPRAMTLYAALVGVGLALGGVPVPAGVGRWGVIEVLFYLGAFGGYLGIGLRLRLGDGLVYIREHLLLAGMKFAMVPMVAAAVLWAIGQTPWGMNPVAARVMLIESFMPAGIICVMLANLFGLDARMASSVWAWNTALFCVVPLPVILWWVG